MKVSIGKNTLGGGKKMTTNLNNYNRSTHDLSSICRTTMAPGVLVPTLKLKMLPGDTFPISTRCHTLTHPTIGPLFGSFKQQNDFFFCPDRLYQAMLHNNALNIGLDMKKVKYPIYTINLSKFDDSKKMEGSNGSLLKMIHPSSLLFYLGYKNLKINPNQESWSGNVTPVIGYFDIFKNFYANKQEENFYMIGAPSFMPNTNNLEDQNKFLVVAYEAPTGSTTDEYTAVEILNNGTSNQTINNSGKKVAFGIEINNENQVNDANLIIDIEYFIVGSGGGEYKYKGSISELINSGVAVKNTTPNGAYVIDLVFTNTIRENSIIIRLKKPISIQIDNIQYKSYKLTEIDDMREDILAAGRNQYDFSRNTNFGNEIFGTMKNPDDTAHYITKSAYPMVGLLLKTYQSDINTNWVNTEWIDGDNGINAITAIDTSSGSFNLDTLNLAKKVYNMLNRIAVSDGSYNAWIQTVWTSGGLNHIETPIYLGGSSLEIEFQEVINNSGTENQPLGSLAGRGVATNRKGGEIIFKADEPGYLFCISSITPRVDYFQGNDWDVYTETLDDLHKPQLDGIGFQDRLYRHLNASAPIDEHNLSIGKQPAWIEYMTAVNKTYGNFALVENEGWMCLNRVFGDIDTYTTYIFPHLYNNIFADTDISAQNFWVQIGFNTEARRVMSAKVIPNI